MGCTQSKIENEEAVARCKDRKNFMKDAVSARNAFAAAHSSYATYLKNTGAALSDFSQGEVQNPQFTPTIPNSSVPIQTPFEIIPPPPPPPHSISPAPLYRSATMPEMTSKPQLEPVGTIIEEEEDDDKELENDGALNSRLRRRRSNRNSGGSSRGATKEMVEDEEEEEDRPPAPPPLSKSKPATQFETNQPNPPPHPAFEYFFPQMENTPGTSLSAAEEVNMINKEEIERKEFNEKPHIVRGGRDEVPEPVPTPENVAEPPQEAMMLAQNGKSSKKGKQGQVSIVEGKIMKQKVNLIQIFSDLDDHFLKASESAHEVSKMLEATRMHYHSNFADNRGNVLDFFNSE